MQSSHINFTRSLTIWLVLLTIVVSFGKPTFAAVTQRQQARANAALLRLWEREGSVQAPKVTVAQVKAALARGANVNTKDKDGATALMCAVASGQIECASFLMSKGANINIKDNDGDIALMFAAMSGNANSVKFLMSNGADVNARDNSGNTALLDACEAQGNTLDCIKILVARGADVNVKSKGGETALMEATASHLGIVAFLKNKDATFFGDAPITVPPPFAKSNPNSVLFALWFDKHNQYDGDQAATINVAQVKKALDAGADVNAQDKDGWTSLIVAAWAGNIDCVKYLVSKGADLEAKRKDGRTALLIAEVNLDCVRYLVSKGANMNAPDWRGYTLLLSAVHDACAAGTGVGSMLDCAKFLISKGADVNAKACNGDTALSLAQGHPGIIAILKAAGAK